MTALGQKLLKAIESNNTKWFERLLKTQKCSVAPLDFDWIFYHACTKQRVEIIDLIPQDPRFDSSIGNPYTFAILCPDSVELCAIKCRFESKIKRKNYFFFFLFCQII